MLRPPAVVLASLVALLAVGCVERADRTTLRGVVAADDAKAQRAAAARSASFAPVPPWKQWRFAGTRDGEHLVVHVTADGQRHRYALPESQYVMPVALAATEDESRWVALKPVDRVRADGSLDLDFTRLSSIEIDALHSGATATGR